MANQIPFLNSQLLKWTLELWRFEVFFSEVGNNSLPSFHWQLLILSLPDPIFFSYFEIPSSSLIKVRHLSRTSGNKGNEFNQSFISDNTFLWFPYCVINISKRNTGTEDLSSDQGIQPQVLANLINAFTATWPSSMSSPCPVYFISSGKSGC